MPMRPSDDDWRLMGQDRYLMGSTLYWRRWTQPREDWDHDHCEFCGAKFMDAGVAKTLQEGYTTADSRHWICDPCFNDFKDRFHWKVTEEK